MQNNLPPKAEQPALTDPGSELRQQQEDDALPEHIESLFVRPQEEWGTEEWRELAFYLEDEVKRLTAELETSTQTLSQAAASLEAVRGSLADSRKYRTLVAAVNRGIYALVACPAKKQPGRKKKLTDEIAFGLAEVAARHGPKEAAKRLARKQLEQFGKNHVRDRHAFEARTKTWENKISSARAIVRESLFREHGNSLAFLSAADRLKVRPNRGRKKK